MKIHSDIIFAPHIWLALDDPFFEGVWIDQVDSKGSRSRERGFIVSLAASPKIGRRRKRNMQHVKNDPPGVVAATYDEWGVFIRNLFRVDSNAIIGQYKGVEDFHRQTRDAFRWHPWTLEHPARCTGCLPVDDTIKQRISA